MCSGEGPAQRGEPADAALFRCRFEFANQLEAPALAALILQFDVGAEADAAAKPFATEYYNAEIHRAALATPEFMRRALAGLWEQP